MKLWSQGNVTLEEGSQTCYVACFKEKEVNETTGSRWKFCQPSVGCGLTLVLFSKECRWPLEARKGKEQVLPSSLWQEPALPARQLVPGKMDFEPLTQRTLKNENLCASKP